MREEFLRHCRLHYTEVIHGMNLLSMTACSTIELNRGDQKPKKSEIIILLINFQQETQQTAQIQ